MPTHSVERTSTLTRRVLAPNAGPMTLGGTNSYLIAAPGSSGVVVVDPGPTDHHHLATLASFGHVELILLTHRHPDHSASIQQFAALTGAIVRAADPAFCVAGAALADGEQIVAAGTDIRVLCTPGHTSDSVCFQLPDDAAHGSVLTGDTILGSGTTIIDAPDGTLRDYLDSLAALRRLGPALVLPAHGPVLPDLVAICDAYTKHRLDRLDQIRDALTQLGQDASVSAVTDAVYAETDASVRFAAEASVRAQLAYLRDRQGG
jgi:glyoxylase-like metal-dependent hydrolase (beta-lactamase superfamily II)